MSLDSEIASLQSATANLIADVPKAIADIKGEVNLTTGALLVCETLKGTAGTTISWNITLLPGNTLPTALQSDIVLPSGISVVSIAIGPTGSNANKSIQSSIVNGNLRFLMFGLNSTVMAQGVVVIVQLAIASGIKGILPICLIAPAISDGAGNGIPVSTISGMVMV